MAPGYRKQHDQFDTLATHIHQVGKASTDLEDFLAEKKPTTTKDFMGAHWVVVAKDDQQVSPPPTDDQLATIQAQGQRILKKLSETRDDIEFDDSIPQRTSDKKGRGKKALKEQAQDKARIKLQSLALKTTTVGFWSFFSAGSRVDKIFAALSKSLLEGALKQTTAYMVRCHTSPSNRGDKYKFQVQVMFGNVFDEEDAKEILDIMIEKLQLRPADARSEVWTVLGLTEADGPIDPWIHRPSEFFESSKALAEKLKEARENAKHAKHAQDEDEIESPPRKKKKSKGQLEDGQVTLTDFMARVSSSAPNHPSSSSGPPQRKKAALSSDDDDHGGRRSFGGAGNRLDGSSANLGQGSYRLGSSASAPGPSSAGRAAAERRQDEQQQKKKQKAKAPLVVDEDGAIVLD